MQIWTKKILKSSEKFEKLLEFEELISYDFKLKLYSHSVQWSAWNQFKHATKEEDFHQQLLLCLTTRCSYWEWKVGEEKS